MYNNIGGKVKALAIVEMIVGTLGSLITAIVLWANDAVLAGFLVLIGGFLVSWIGSWITYAIGDTNETVNGIRSMLQTQEATPDAPRQPVPQAKAASAYAPAPKKPAPYRPAPIPASERERILSQGGWECPCGSVNHSYISTCVCGRNKREVLAAKQANEAK